ncbi:MAG: peptidyl-prolyl cis-trans isomerase [Treponema sp.]|jgi:parvulin-like peptidyl-prolyl isomerase|nr:peptidyl-prolyl cis-trans isomerase [Treponema sp.]
MKRFVSIVLFSVLFAGMVSAQSQAQTDVLTVATITLTSTEAITGRELRQAIDRTVRLQIISSYGTYGPALAVQNTSQLDTAVAEYVKNLTRENKLQVLDSLINEKLFFQAAVRERITVTQADVDNELTTLRSQLAASLNTPLTNDTDLERVIRSIYGYSLTEYKDYIRRQVMINRYVQKVKGDKLQVATPTEAEVQRYYSINKTQFIQPDMIFCYLIEVPFGTDKAKAKTQAETLVRDIGGNGDKFNTKVVEGQASGAYNAGPLGNIAMTAENETIISNRYGSALFDTMFGLAKGAVSSIVEGTQAYYIVRVTEKTDMKILGLTDVNPNNTSQTIRDFIRAVLFQERQAAANQTALNELLAELRTDRTFKILDQNLTWL